jgi:hypothetical protein
MNHGLGIRVTSLALAAMVTLSLMAGLDALAHDRRADGLMSQACERGQVAAVPAVTTRGVHALRGSA